MLHNAHVQVIKKWYAELPDKLGRELAKQKKTNTHQTDQEKEQADDRQERKYMKKEGFSEDQIQDAEEANSDEDPVTAGT